jgi:hypothetical protein
VPEIFCNSCGNSHSEEGFDVVRTVETVYTDVSVVSSAREIRVSDAGVADRCCLQLRCRRCDRRNSWPESGWDLWVCGALASGELLL